jgi:hypothetical protein
MLTLFLAPMLSGALALQSAPAPTAPEPAPLSQENRALLRCAAAFALVAQGQAAGDPQAKAWPDLTLRGREFFVRALAQLMDATGRDRAGIAALANSEAQALAASGEVHKVMPSCLLMLEAAQL